MSLSNIPLFNMLRDRMQWINTRQHVLADNIANANTPGYQAQDLKELNFRNELNSSIRPVKLAATSAGHITTTPSGEGLNGAKKVDSPDSEIAPSGNSVVLEEQMFKVAKNQMDYQTATTLYSKGLSLIRLAVTGRA